MTTGYEQRFIGEFGGEEFMPVSPEMLADITEQKAARQRFVELTRRVLPDYSIGGLGVDFARFQNDLETNPDKIIKAFQVSGQTPDTEEFLKLLGLQPQDIFKPPVKFLGFEPVEEPLFPWGTEFIADITRRQADVKRIQDSLLKLYPDSDLTGIAEFMKTNPQDFLGAVKAQGRNIETDNILRAFVPSLTENEVRDFWYPPTPIKAEGGVVASFTAGVGDLVSNIGGIFRWAGKDGIGDKLTEFGSFLQVQAKPDDLGEFNWGMLLNPEFYTQRVVRTLPSTMVLAIPGIGAYGLAGSIAGKVALGGFGRAIIAGVGGAAMSRPLESAMEAAGSFDAAIQQGLSREQAEQAANETFKGNMTLMGLDAAQTALAFAPTPGRIGNLVARGLVKTATIGGKMVIEGLTEGGEEMFQQVIQKKALGDDRGFLEMLQDPDMKEVFSIGALIGLGMGAGGDAIQTISNRTKNTFTPEQRAKFDTEKAGFIEQGLDDDVATIKALDVMAEDKGIAKTVQDISKQVDQDMAIDQVKPKTEGARLAWERIKEKLLDERGSIGKVPEEGAITPGGKPENPYLKMPIERVRKDADYGVKAAQEALAAREGKPIEAPPVAVPLVAKVEPEVPPAVTPEAEAGMLKISRIQRPAREPVKEIERIQRPAKITKDMESRLKAMGVTEAEIGKMTPQQAWDKLGIKVPAVPLVAKVGEEAKVFHPDYIKWIETIKGERIEDFQIKKVPKAGIAVWRAIDKATGIDIGGGSTRALAQDVINRTLANKAKIAPVEKVTPEVTTDEAIRRFEEIQKVKQAKIRYGIDITKATEEEYVKAGMVSIRKEVKELGFPFAAKKQEQLLREEYQQLAIPKAGIPVEAAKPPVAPPVKAEVPPAITPEVEGRNIPTPEQKASIPPNLPPSEQVAAHINFEPDKVSLKEKFESGKNKAIVHWIDRLYPVDKFVSEAKKTGIDLSIEENPYLLARLMEGVTSKATSFIENGTFGRQFWKTEKGKIVPNFKGESLSQILESVKKPALWKDFSTYLTSVHAQELSTLGIETGIDPFVADASIMELETKYPDFPKLASKIQKYQSDLLDYIQESGLINQELRNKLDAKYYAYVPFYRVMDELASKGYMGKKMVDIASPIKRIKGSEREIINPLESILKNTYAMISAADRNQVGVAMARIAHDVPDVEGMFRHIKTPIAKVATVTAKELGIEIPGLTDAETEEVFNVFRPSLFKAENVATVMIDGKKQFFEVDPDLNKALHAMDSASMGMLWKVLSAPAKWLRAGATLSPDFMIRNPARDAMSAFVFSRYGFIPGIDFMKGVASILRKDNAYKLYKMSGGEHSMLVSLDRDYLQHSFKEVVEGKKFTDYVKHPLALFQIISELGEKATRLGEFKKGLSAKVSPLEAGMASREVTLDFAKAGTQARAVNQIIAFFNATIRGWERPIQAFKEAPVRTSVKIFVGITLPSIILWAVNHDEDWWKEVPQWQKDLFWLVKIGDTIYRIPKPFELGIIFGSLPERFLDYLVEKDPQAMKDFARNLLESSTPGWIPTGLEPIIENITNHSFFRGIPIVSGAKRALPPEFQYTQYTSEVAKGLGALLKQSPAKIDNVIQGWTGGLGRYATQVIDKLLQGTGVVPTKIEPSPTAADIPALRAFVVRNPMGGSSASVEKFYDTLEEYTAQEQRMKMLLDDKKVAEYEFEKAEHPELLLNYDNKTNTVYSATTRYLRQVSGELSDIRKLQDKIYKSMTMTPEKKRELIDGLDQIKTQLAQKALALIKNPGGEAGVLEVPPKDLENKLGTVLNPVPPISKDTPDVYRTPELAKELGQVKGESKLKTLLDKNNTILTDIANLPDSALYKIDRTVSKAGLTRVQNELLDRYDAAENKKAFLELHPEVKINPKADWLKKNPESNAILALWGNAKILSQKAYDIAQGLIESNDVPENAFPLKTMPPKEVAKSSFEYEDAVEKYGGTSVQARYIRAKDDKFNEWLGLTKIDEDIKGLELKVKNYDLQKEYEGFSDKDSPNFKDDVKKDVNGLTERDRAQMQFKASNKDWADDVSRIQARSVGTRDKPTPDETVDKWVERGRVARESKGYDAEEKVWYLDNYEIYKWAYANKLMNDGGSKWNEDVLRIQVKPEFKKIVDTKADYEMLPSIPNERDPQYKTGREYMTAQLMATKEGIAYQEDKDRIYAYEHNGTDFVETMVKYGRVAREFGGGSSEAKLFRYNEDKFNFWGSDKSFEGGQKWEPLDMSKSPIWKIDVQWRKQDTEYKAILAKYPGRPEEEVVEAKAYLAKNKDYRIARIRRVGYELGLRDEKALVFPTPEKTIMENWVEHQQLSISGYRRDRYLLENPDFLKAVNAAKKSKGQDEWATPDATKIPDVRYDLISEQYEDLFDKYERADEEGKKVILVRNPDFQRARWEQAGYLIFVGNRDFVPDYVGYRELKEKGAPGFEDDWYLLERPRFYQEMVKRGAMKTRNFSKVPSREVFRLYKVYDNIIGGPEISRAAARRQYRREHPELDAWLVLIKAVKEPIEVTDKEAGLPEAQRIAMNLEKKRTEIERLRKEIGRKLVGVR